MARRRQWRLRPRAAVLLALVGAAVLAGPAVAKEDVQATLLTPVQLDATPGEEITVAWTLVSIDDQGKQRPFGASGVYIRLSSAVDGEPTIGAAAGDEGRYEATVLVPEGGIGSIKIGLQGWMSDPTGTHRSDVFFPIANNPLPEVTEPPSPQFTFVEGQLPPRTAARTPKTLPGTAAATSDSDAGSRVTWIAVGLSLLLAVGVATGVLLRRRRPAPAA